MGPRSKINLSPFPVITSSRNCVKYIREVEFLGITLLPFTKKTAGKFYLRMDW